MIPLATAAEIRAIEAAANADSHPFSAMMEAAGAAVARRIMAAASHLSPETPPRITVLVGPGRNGQDGLIAAHHAAQQPGLVVRSYLLARPDESDPLIAQARVSGVFLANAEDDQRHRLLTQLVASADILVDALYGISVRLPLPANAAQVLKIANAERHDGQVVIAVDCPSGLEADSGAADANTLPADETVTFIAIKPSQVASSGVALVGSLFVNAVGITQATIASHTVSRSLITAADARALLPRRPLDANKGTFGKVLIVGGSANYIGAVALSARAAYRAGAGLVTVATLSSLVQGVAHGLPEATWLPCPGDAALTLDALPLLVEAMRGCDVLALGMGLGNSDGTRQLVLALLSAAKALSLPVIIDADALNALAAIERWWEHLPENAIITPHPGEMSRLTGEPISTVQSTRLEIATSRAAFWKTTILLKGAHTVVASPTQTVVLPYKTSSLAKAGTGDVLAGVIAALRHSVGSAHDAAVLGAMLHAQAGVMAAQHVGSAASVIASDVIEQLGHAWGHFEQAPLHHAPDQPVITPC